MTEMDRYLYGLLYQIHVKIIFLEKFRTITYKYNHYVFKRDLYPAPQGTERENG